MCGKSGIVHDFILFQGKTTEFDQTNIKSFGLGASVVLELTKQLKKENYCVYFDNFFSTLNLFKILKNNKIFTAGTVRVDRFCKPPFMSDKECSKKPKGFH